MRVQPIIVSLSGFLALSGINLVILPRPGGTAPEWMSNWGAGTSIFSPALFMVAAATIGWLIFSTTAFYGHLRLMGSDERAAYTSGVRIGVVRIGAHVVSGLFAGLAALAFTALISSGDPTQGTTYTLISVTALVLGGTSLAGGRATVFGSLLGALNLFLIGYVLSTFDFGSVQGFVTDLCYGVILVLSLLLTVALPYLQRWLRYVSPLLRLRRARPGLHRRRAARDLRLHDAVAARAAAAPTLGPADQPAPPPLDRRAACSSRSSRGRASCARCSRPAFRSSPCCCSPSSSRSGCWSGRRPARDDAAALCRDRRRRRARRLAADGHRRVRLQARALRDARWPTVLSSPLSPPRSSGRCAGSGSRSRR